MVGNFFFFLSPLKPASDHHSVRALDAHTYRHAHYVFSLSKCIFVVESFVVFVRLPTTVGDRLHMHTTVASCCHCRAVTMTVRPKKVRRAPTVAKLHKAQTTREQGVKTGTFIYVRGPVNSENHIFLLKLHIPWPARARGGGFRFGNRFIIIFIRKF